MQRYLVIAVCFALVVATSCLQSTTRTPTSVSLPGSKDLPTNNGLCLVCHLDFDEDPITTDHLRKGITCAHCHGKSTAHMHDETMMTSPDVLYGRMEVETMCKNCHRPHKNTRAVDAFQKKWLGRKRENGRSITTGSTCTDCHGLHTIPRR
jgi:hypothetical protein